MSSSKLLSGEKVLMSSNKNILTLTNYRVRLIRAKKGESTYMSIALDCIASCGLVTKTKPLLLVIAAISGFMGIIESQKPLGNISHMFFIGALILVIIYFVFQSSVIAISSNGGDKITAPVSGMNRKDILEFLEAVEHARFKYMGKISG